ncbi:hypothetical protein [Formosa maritima]|uniref:Flavodoxin-like domain-containing protein n=1 Tax=Formosa maritima TaxID=2592046 RepID=A0A5D0GGY6_9FLAO|nr:hypothetical protein [Formosa maritima]TYA58051.1 hypothetical protein FVF61_04355 [Formosa maritima]
MSQKKIIIVLILSIIGIGVIILTWYKINFSMDEANSFEVNNSNFPTKILIATQGSEFKNELTTQVVNYYREDSIYIKVIDISQLSKVKATNYNAVLLIHTWENWKAPEEIVSFISENSELANKIVAFTTSGNGSNKLDNVDAITGESNMDDIRLFANQIIVKLEHVLKNK